MSDSDSSVSSAIQTPPIRIRQKYNRTEQNEPVAEQRKIAPDKPVEPVAITPPSAPEPVNYKKYIVIAIPDNPMDPANNRSITTIRVAKSSCYKLNKNQDSIPHIRPQDIYG